MPDTVGIASPNRVAERVKALQTRYPETPLEVHFHDDLGFALVNALEAVRSGAQYVNTTLFLVRNWRAFGDHLHDCAAF